MDYSRAITNAANSELFITIAVVLWVVMIVLSFVANWKIFVKAGRPGWMGLIPLYNLYILLKIADKSGWLLILFLIPISLVQLIAVMLLGFGIGKAFGKGTAYTVFLLILIPIGYLFIAFDKSKYIGNPNKSKEVESHLPPQQLIPTTETKV